MSRTTNAEAAQARAASQTRSTSRPSERRSALSGERGTTTPVRSAVRVERADGEGGPADVVLRGFASVTEAPYPMYDSFGPYTEVVSAGAFARTLGSDPDVKLLFNHRGMPLARTRVEAGKVGSLELREVVEGDTTGLSVRALPAMTLPISREVVDAIDAGLLDEMSFAFTITRGVWSPDYTEYRIDEVDLDRGDVAVVTYGANPATFVGLDQPAADAARSQTPSADLRSVKARLQLLELSAGRA